MTMTVTEGYKPQISQISQIISYQLRHLQLFIQNRALNPVNIGPLVVLRVAFGLLMFISMVRFMALGWIRELYVLPQVHFTYAGFEWVRPVYYAAACESEKMSSSLTFLITFPVQASVMGQKMV